jgi:hypothetical protein
LLSLLLLLQVAEIFSADATKGDKGAPPCDLLLLFVVLLLLLMLLQVAEIFSADVPIDTCGEATTSCDALLLLLLPLRCCRLQRSFQLMRPSTHAARPPHLVVPHRQQQVLLLLLAAVVLLLPPCCCVMWRIWTLL